MISKREQLDMGFPLYVQQVGGKLHGKESYSQRASREKREMLERGINPGSGAYLALPGEPAFGERCGSCLFLVAHSYGKTYFKCKKGKTTASEKTDIRKKWPACRLWEPRKEEK